MGYPGTNFGTIWIKERPMYEKSIKTMLFGAGEAGKELLQDLARHPENPLQIVCIIDDDTQKHGSTIYGIPVVGGREKIIDSVQRYDIQTIVLAIPTVDSINKKEILSICQQTCCTLKTLPALSQFVDPNVNIRLVRDVRIDDLLGRIPNKIDISSIDQHVDGKTILVTGAGGSIGSELCRQISHYTPRKLILFDIHENSVYSLQQELLSKYPQLDFATLIGSIRDYNRIESIIKKFRPDMIFHAAAHKHVPLMESSPHEAIKNNVLATWNLVKTADKYNVSNFLLISTDKAVNPTNIMGASKRVCEMIIQMYNQISKTEFVAVRFGNVLDSSGSVVPLFRKQIASGGPVTVTHPDVNRFFMTIPEAVSLVLAAGASASGGEIFILDMGEPVKIVDMAEKLIRLSGYVPGRDIQIVFTGLRPGEKLYEEILMNEEGLRKTANEKIYVANPIKFDERVFYSQLETLARIVDDDSINIREEIQKILPTYHPAC